MLVNIYHEARGDTMQGMEAVALVTLNRAKAQGKSICEIVYQHKQFSWTMMSKIKRKPLLDNYNTVHRVASKAMADTIIDFTGGATHYHTKKVKPYWAKTLDKIGSVGSHIFYRKKQDD
jgi:spore germination cell wall hydrolase CwlJ-like protein